jgi:hypothetical protein
LRPETTAWESRASSDIIISCSRLCSEYKVGMFQAQWKPRVRHFATACVESRFQAALSSNTAPAKLLSLLFVHTEYKAMNQYPAQGFLAQAPPVADMGNTAGETAEKQPKKKETCRGACCKEMCNPCNWCSCLCECCCMMCTGGG